MALRKKIIIDTDTGIDDAMAILMALEAHKRKAVEVIAVTAVSGNTTEPDAERSILRTLDAAGCGDIPVYKGAEEALVIPYPHEEHYHGEDGFNNVKFPTSPDMRRINKEPAWNVISRLSKEYPHEITIVAIGPLTNVALAMKTDPGLAERLREMFIMGGNIEGYGNVTEAAEFNFHADPEAAYIVLRLTRCPTMIAPWELSYKYNKVDFGWRTEVLGKLTTPAAQLINACEEVIISIITGSVHESTFELVYINTELQTGICFGGHIEPCKGLLKKKKTRLGLQCQTPALSKV